MALTSRTKRPGYAERITSARDWRLANAPAFDAMDRASLFADSAARHGSSYAHDWRERNRAHFDAMDEALMFSDSPTIRRCQHCGERA
jgi:hypothetical protein